MAGHPDPGALAEWREGLPGRWRSARLRAHLARCSHCAAIDRDLTRITAALAAAPVPPMPDRVVARLEDALAAQARDSALSSATRHVPAGETPGAATPAGPLPAGGTADEPSSRQRDRTRRRFGPLRPATLGTAAIALAVLAAGGYGLTQLNDQGASTGGTDAGSASGPEGGPAQPVRNGASSQRSPGEGSASQVPMVHFQLVHSGTDYQPGQLAAQVKAVLADRDQMAGVPAEAEPADRNGPSDGSRGRTASPGPPARPTRLQECVTLITGGTAPGLVDGARYQGQPATIIVRSATSTRTGQIWVAGAACSATSRDLLAHTALARTG